MGQGEGALVSLTTEASCKDEMRLGQKNGIVRQWARRGSRPRQPADQRSESASLFGAICPARGMGAALALPFANTDAMQLHLDEIARTVARGAHAVLRLDRAGWHTTTALRVPKTLTMILLPSRAPELNPVETIWQTVCPLPKRRWLVPRYAANEGGAGWTGAEPHAEGTSHETGERSLCRS